MTFPVISLSLHEDVKLKCQLLLHSSVLYVLQLVGRAQENFHTPPIVVAADLTGTSLRAGARFLGGHRERAARPTAVHTEKTQQLVTDGVVSSSFFTF